MVFGDNVRARKAARALPRTPPTRETKEEEEETEKANEETTHTYTHPHPPPFHNTAQQDNTHTTLKHTPQHIKSRQRTVDTTRPSTQHKPSPLFHNDTTLSQRHGTKSTMLRQGTQTVDRRRGEERRSNARGTRQCEGEYPIRTRGQHTTTTPRHSIGPQGKRQGGTPTRRRGRQHADGETGSTAALPSPCHPPPQRHPTVHDSPTLHHNEGGADRGYPTTRTPQTHTHHPHTTPGNEQCTTRQQYSPALQWDE